jgi:hypothetical protein
MAKRPHPGGYYMRGTLSRGLLAVSEAICGSSAGGGVFFARLQGGALGGPGPVWVQLGPPHPPRRGRCSVRISDWHMTSLVISLNLIGAMSSEYGPTTGTANHLRVGVELARRVALRAAMYSPLLSWTGCLRWLSQGANWVVPPPSAPLLELAPLAMLSFLVSSRHTRRSALPPGYRGGSWRRFLE